MFLNRLKWKTTTGEFDEMDMLCIGSFRWTFEQPLSRDIQYSLLDLVENMDLYDDKSYVLLYIWLVQHDVKVKLTQKWDFEESITYNLKKWRLIRALRKDMRDVDKIKLLKIFEEKGAGE